MDRVLKRMDSIYDRVRLLLLAWDVDRPSPGSVRWNAQCGDDRYAFARELIKTVPPGKPIPPASKQIHDSVNSYVNRAKSSIENTVNSAKSGDMKDKLADSMSTFGEKVSSMMDKAKSSVQNLRNSNVCVKQGNHSKEGSTPRGESTSTPIFLSQG